MDKQYNIKQKTSLKSYKENKLESLANLGFA